MQYIYSGTALVLAALTIGQVSAASFHHRHAHDKRAPAPSAAPVAKAAPQDGYYKGVQITYSANQNWGTWGGVPAAEPTNPAAPPVYEHKAEAPKPVVEEQKYKQAPAELPEKKKESHPYHPDKKPTSGGPKGGISDLSAAVFKKLNAQPVVPNGMVTDTPDKYSMDLCNESGEELGFYCWPGSSGWNIAVDNPIFAATIPAGKSHTVYMGVGCIEVACAALHSDARIDSANGIPIETQIEFTMDKSDTDATFDVSQLETASGHAVRMESSVCHAETGGKCSYQCKGSAPCGYGSGEVFVKDCLGPGTNGNPGATDGGCSVGPEKHIKVTFG